MFTKLATHSSVELTGSQLNGAEFNQPAIVVGPMLEFLEYTACRPRTYEQAMEAWRSSCPRLTIWEDALIGGLIEVLPGDAHTPEQVRLTTAGLLALRNARRNRVQREVRA